MYIEALVDQVAQEKSWQSRALTTGGQLRLLCFIKRYEGYKTIVIQSGLNLVHPVQNETVREVAKQRGSGSF